MLNKVTAPTTERGTKNLEFLRKIREKRGLSKYGMAKLLGFLPPTYNHYEASAKGLSLEALVTIKQKLDLSWEKLGKMIEREVERKKQ